MLKNLASEFETFRPNQVPREENAKVDALANLRSSLRIPPKTKIPIIHILIPIIEDLTKKLKDPENHGVERKIWEKHLNKR